MSLLKTSTEREAIWVEGQWVKSTEVWTQEKEKLSISGGSGFPCWKDPRVDSPWYPKGRCGASCTGSANQVLQKHLGSFQNVLSTRDQDLWHEGLESTCYLSSLGESAAAAAKSLQSCPTLCDPIDGSPPGSPIPGILQARTLEWVAIAFTNAWKWKVKVKSPL